MENINKRVKYKIVLDCEACPLDKDFQGVDPFNMLMYDLGWAVVDRNGTVYKTQSFVNSDVYNGEKELMQSAYYANKLPQYEKDLESGKRKLATLYEIRQALLNDLTEYGVEQVFAHNMRFDYNTLNNTQRWETKSKYRYFLPYGLEICDTLKLARQLIAPMKSYRKFCIENGYMTKNNQVRLTAEIIYRFISKELDFVESHTGLEDVLIEKEILAYCYRKHKKMYPLLWG